MAALGQVYDQTGGWSAGSTQSQNGYADGYTGQFAPSNDLTSGDGNADQVVVLGDDRSGSTATTSWRIRKRGKLVSIDGSPLLGGSFKEARANKSSSIFEQDDAPEIELNSQELDLRVPSLTFRNYEPYSDYRVDESSFSYIPGNSDQFGWISFESLPYLKRGTRSGFTTGFNMHLLSGPISVPLPPRLYDFSLGYQNRGDLGDMMSYDVGTSIGVFSDFEDSARDGVRFPSHAVGMLHLKPEMDVVFGVDYVSRDDIKLLPVFGVSWRPISMERMRFDMVFPRPRVDYTFSDRSKAYLAGRLGGGTWDIEFPNDANDVMTYKDLQLLFGLERLDGNGNSHACELGYVFDRQLQFRTLDGTTHFDDAFVLRFVTRR